MITSVPEKTKDQPAPEPTVWGLNAAQLHDRFWAARGVQVIRQGVTTPIAHDAEFYLLTDADSLSIFRLGELADTLGWIKPHVLFVRLHDPHDPGYREHILTDEQDNFVRFDRAYRHVDFRLARVALTPHEDIALAWQKDEHPRKVWRQLRRSVPSHKRATISVDGRVFDHQDDNQVMDFVRELIQVWKRPDATNRRALRLEGAGEAWADNSVDKVQQTRFVGSVWVGAGRDLAGVESVVGPAVLWDDPESPPAIDALEWSAIEPVENYYGPRRGTRGRSLFRVSKRLFDVAFALLALALTLPFYPLIMLAIFIEDGSPFFFGHRRESVGGREFPCLKFRTMYNNSEEIKQKLAAENQADGPQFFMENDPRITRVGRFMRKTNIDELPQFFNVLVGQMSVIGPRPSPYKENQFSPAWREARLSTRPGVTGLWQIKRSREPGMDFQEWIRYDIKYVENMCWKLDIFILYRTLLVCLGIQK